MKMFVMILVTALAASAATAAAQLAVQSAGQLPDPAPADPTAKESLDVQYARTFLKLAQLELQRAQDTNRTIPGTFTGTAVDALRQTVTLAEAQLASALNPQANKPAVFLVNAENNVRAAEENYKRLEAIDRQRPGTISPLALERSQLTFQLAQIALEKARAVDPMNHQAFLQWQIDRLREEVVSLRNRVAQLSRMN
jgi:hypothetical protein